MRQVVLASIADVNARAKAVEPSALEPSAGPPSAAVDAQRPSAQMGQRRHLVHSARIRSEMTSALRATTATHSWTALSVDTVNDEVC